MALIQTGPDESAAMQPEHSEIDDIVAIAPRNGSGGHRNGQRGNGSAHVWVDVGRPSASGAPAQTVLIGDARELPIGDASVDLIATSPPYWQKRDYGIASQIGQESTPKGDVDAMIECLREWRRVLRPTGSVFLNIGDTFHKRMLAAIPARVEAAAGDDGWIIRNRIIWAKDGGMPEPAQNRLANRHEYILHLVAKHDYYYDLFGYARAIGNGTIQVTSGGSTRNETWETTSALPDRDRAAGSPASLSVCRLFAVWYPAQRIVERTAELDPSARKPNERSELAPAAGLTPEHIAAIQATGVSDAGKALRTQNGTGRNAAAVKVLAAEAKAVLGGYFREFTFAQRRSTGWSRCECRAKFARGVVLDPFMGTGTTLSTALEMDRSAIGVDLDPH